LVDGLSRGHGNVDAILLMIETVVVGMDDGLTQTIVMEIADRRLSERSQEGDGALLKITTIVVKARDLIQRFDMNNRRADYWLTAYQAAGGQGTWTGVRRTRCCDQGNIP
jgi:hypothetical protein